MAPSENRRGFDIAIICAMPIERAAVEAVMDRDYLDGTPEEKRIVRSYSKTPGDTNQYIYGELASKPVVVVTSPDTGTLNVALAARTMQQSFINIAVALVVGITGGTPFTAAQHTDGGPKQSGIRLGDVIISKSMFEYDSGKQYENCFLSNTDHDRRLAPAAGFVRGFLIGLEGNSRAYQRLVSATNQDVDLPDSERQSYCNPGREHDHIYPVNRPHRCRGSCVNCDSGVGVCQVAISSTCQQLGCEPGEYPVGQTRCDTEIFTGPYVAGSGVMKSAARRQELVERHGAMAIEMEGAGVWAVFPTIVVKGVVDYADSHKNKVWRKYPAIKAALCAKGIVDALVLPTIPTMASAARVSSTISHPPSKSQSTPVNVARFQAQNHNLTKAVQEFKNKELWKAAKEGQDCRMERLMNEGADPDAPDEWERMALHLTCKNGHSNSAERLVTWYCVDVNAVDGWDWTPIFWATWRGSVETVDMLLKNRARLTQGASPLSTLLLRSATCRL